MTVADYGSKLALYFQDEVQQRIGVPGSVADRIIADGISKIDWVLGVKPSNGPYEGVSFGVLSLRADYPFEQLVEAANMVELGEYPWDHEVDFHENVVSFLVDYCTNDMPNRKLRLHANPQLQDYCIANGLILFKKWLQSQPTNRIKWLGHWTTLRHLVQELSNQGLLPAMNDI